MREPKLKDLIGQPDFSATEYLKFMSAEKERKLSLRQRQIARLMKERGFSVFMVGQTQRERKIEESA